MGDTAARREVRKARTYAALGIAAGMAIGGYGIREKIENYRLNEELLKASVAAVHYKAELTAAADAKEKSSVLMIEADNAHHCYVDLKVPGRETSKRFLLDTGSDPTFMSLADAVELFHIVSPKNIRFDAGSVKGINDDEKKFAEFRIPEIDLGNGFAKLEFIPVDISEGPVPQPTLSNAILAQLHYSESLSGCRLKIPERDHHFKPYRITALRTPTPESPDL